MKKVAGNLNKTTMGNDKLNLSNVSTYDIINEKVGNQIQSATNKHQ